MKLVFLTISFFLTLASNSFGQEESQGFSYNELLAISKEIITETGYCTLITLDEKGQPRARLMDPFIPKDGLTIWFGTNPKSRKVKQIKNDPRVTLFYMASDTTGYVTIHGEAELINDLNEKEQHWKNKWKDFHPDYPEDYLLIKVSPLWLEVISTKYNINGDSITWQPPKLILDLKK